MSSNSKFTMIIQRKTCKHTFTGNTKKLFISVSVNSGGYLPSRE